MSIESKASDSSKNTNSDFGKPVILTYEPASEGEAREAKNLGYKALAISTDGVKDYLNRISQIALLTHEEEISLAKRIEAGVLAEHKLRDSRNLTTDDQRDLKWVKKDGDRAAETLLEANLRLVVSIAKNFAGEGFALLDLVQEGNMGLIIAMEKFDYKLGFRFSTYATWWIRQSISRALADKGRIIRLPVHVAEFLKLIGKTEQILLETLGREPTEEEVATELGESPAKIRQAKQHGQSTLSLNSIFFDGDDFNELAEMMVDDSVADSEDAAIELDLIGQLESNLEDLHPREAAIIRARFGMDGRPPRTLEQIGLEFGVTRERIRQIESKTMSKLRHPSRSQMLKDYLEN